MKTWIFICMSIAMLLWFLSTLRRKPSQKKGCIDAIIPAYNEGPCLAQSLDNLLRNPYFCRVICVNDGSTDNTEAVMAEVKRKWGDRFVADDCYEAHATAAPGRRTVYYQRCLRDVPY